MSRENIIRVFIVVVVLASLSSCGGGSNSSALSEPPSTVASSSSSSSNSKKGDTEVEDPNIERYIKEEHKPGAWGMNVGVDFSGFHISGLSYYSSDGESGRTDYDGEYGFYAKEGVTTHFHLGSIEFHPVITSTQLSIFHLVRNHNHLSDEVVNLTRLLMVMDENGYSSNHIRLMEEASENVEKSGLVLNDLYVSKESFSDSPKVKSLISYIGVGDLPGVEEAQTYIYEHFRKWKDNDGYAQWPSGFKIDFDRDGVVNSDDAFPWDSTQWRDHNDDGVGDDPIVEELFLETRGVFQYEIDDVRGHLYVANYKGELSLYDLSTGDMISKRKFGGVITTLKVNKDTGEIYVGLSSRYLNRAYTTSDDLGGSIVVIRERLGGERRRVEIERYPDDIEIKGGSNVYVSALSTASRDGVLFEYDLYLQNEPALYPYNGYSGKLMFFGDKLVVGSPDENNLLNASQDFRRFDSVSFNSSQQTAPFLLESQGILLGNGGEYIDLEDVAQGENLPYPDKSIEIGYYDIRGLSATRGIYDIFDWEEFNQYVATTGSEAIYLNRETLFPHRIFHTNNYYSTIGGALNWRTHAVTVYEDEIYAIFGRRDGTTYISVHDPQCSFCREKGHPVAEISPVSGDSSVQNPVRLSGEGSYDPDSGNSLLYRWDMNGDGLWDTEFLESPYYDAQYEVGGGKTVSLQVMDSSGFTDTDQVAFSLDYGIDLGEYPGGVQISDKSLVVNDVVYDKNRGVMYVSYSEAGQFFIVDTSTSEIIRQFSFRYYTGPVVFSEDSGFVYLGLNPTGCKFSFVDCEDDFIGVNEGVVAKFNVDRQAFVGSFKVDLSPADLFFRDGKLYVSSDTAFNNRDDFDPTISVYDPRSGNKVDNHEVGYGGLREFTNILSVSDYSVCPEEGRRIFEAEIYEYCDGKVNILHETIGYKARSWFIPEEGLLVSKHGDVFDAVEFRKVGYLQFPSSGEAIIEDVSYSIEDEIIAVSYRSREGDLEESLIQYFDLVSYELLGNTPTEGRASWLFYEGGDLIYLERLEDYKYVIQSRQQSCFSC